MSDRRAPELSTAESPSGYRRGGGRKTDTSASSSVGKQVGMNVMVAFLIGGLVLAGWFIANQQQMLAEEQERVNEANDRIANLEQRLMATDSAMSQGGQDTKKQINFWESEIRKLWAVSNERNRKWIKDNEQAVKKMNTSLSEIKATMRELNASVGRHESAFDQQQSLVDNMTSLELQMQQVVRGQRDLVDKVNSATQAVSSLRASLSGKVDDNSEAIASIDAYRVAVNSRLADIERRLGAAGGAGGQ
jgi:DNA repair exonuclease SbcCD ATPase subunit